MKLKINILYKKGKKKLRKEVKWANYAYREI